MELNCFRAELLGFKCYSPLQDNLYGFPHRTSVNSQRLLRMEPEPMLRAAFFIARKDVQYMLREKETHVRFDEVTVASDSPLVGRPISEVKGAEGGGPSKFCAALAQGHGGGIFAGTAGLVVNGHAQ